MKDIKILTTFIWCLIVFYVCGRELYIYAHAIMNGTLEGVWDRFLIILYSLIIGYNYYKFNKTIL